MTLLLGLSMCLGSSMNYWLPRVMWENAPADASTLRYELVEVVQETAVAGESDTALLEQLIDTDWNLVAWDGMTIFA